MTLSVLGFSALAACHGPPKDTAPPSPCAGRTRKTAPAPGMHGTEAGVSHNNLQSWVELLSAPDLRGRHAGSSESRHTAALLAQELLDLGLVPPPTTEDLCQTFPLLETWDQNVIGHLAAAAPVGRQARRVVLLAAHYDGQGLHPSGRSYPGADDNASGVAALLEVARLAARHPARWPVDLVFVAFGAEERGRSGSKAYLAHPTVPLERVDLLINLDMVGRQPPGRPLSVGFQPSELEAGWVDGLLERASVAAGVPVHRLDSAPVPPIISDADTFRPFLPSLHLTTGLHADHHQLTDTPDRIRYDQIESTVKLILAVLHEL